MHKNSRHLSVLTAIAAVMLPAAAAHAQYYNSASPPPPSLPPLYPYAVQGVRLMRCKFRPTPM